MPMLRSFRIKIIDSVRVHRALPLALLSLHAFYGAQAYQQPVTSQLPANPPSTALEHGTSSAGTSTPRRAEVTYNGTMLTVAASDSSLNQILREIARETGMKITGGVTDDRVFGTYGPASPSAVLTTLLDGAGSNMLIVQDAEHKPTELVLSPRVGRVTPPNPNAAGFDDSDGSEAQSQPARSVLPSPPPPSANSRAPFRTGTGGIDTNPAATSPSSTSQQLAFPPVDASTPPSTATTTPTGPNPSPDAVRTPQQIFEQLQRLRQQQTQQQTKPE